MMTMAALFGFFFMIVILAMSMFVIIMVVLHDFFVSNFVQNKLVIVHRQNVDLLINQARHLEIMDQYGIFFHQSGYFDVGRLVKVMVQLEAPLIKLITAKVETIRVIMDFMHIFTL